MGRSQQESEKVMSEVQTESYDQVSTAPTNKVSAAGIGGSVSVVLIWLVTQFITIEIPPEIAAAIATIVSFASGYIVKEKRIVE